jgi:ABC-type branched-subunit amino acid transport system permease subunit
MIEYFTAFNPSNWDPSITFIVWAALLVGGRGNHFGVVLGVILVPVLFIEGTKLLPQIPGHPGLADNLRFVVIGLLIMVTLWIRPRGLFPERRRSFDVPAKR